MPTEVIWSSELKGGRGSVEGATGGENAPQGCVPSQTTWLDGDAGSLGGAERLAHSPGL